MLWSIPLDVRPPGFIKRWLRFVCVASGEYFPVKIVLEDEKAFKEGKPYVVGFEPHSVLPQGITVFSHYGEWISECWLHCQGLLGDFKVLGLLPGNERLLQHCLQCLPCICN